MDVDPLLADDDYGLNKHCIWILPFVCLQWQSSNPAQCFLTLKAALEHFTHTHTPRPRRHTDGPRGLTTGLHADSRGSVHTERETLGRHLTTLKHTHTHTH